MSLYALIMAVSPGPNSLAFPPPGNSLLTSLLSRSLSLSTFRKNQLKIDASRAQGRCQQAVTSLPLARVECQQLTLTLPSPCQPLVKSCSGQSRLQSQPRLPSVPSAFRSL